MECSEIISSQEWTWRWRLYWGCPELQHLRSHPKTRLSISFLPCLLAVRYVFSEGGCTAYRSSEACSSCNLWLTIQSEICLSSFHKPHRDENACNAGLDDCLLAKSRPPTSPLRSKNRCVLRYYNLSTHLIPALQILKPGAELYRIHLGRWIQQGGEESRWWGYQCSR